MKVVILRLYSDYFSKPRRRYGHPRVMDIETFFGGSFVLSCRHERFMSCLGRSILYLSSANIISLCLSVPRRLYPNMCLWSGPPIVFKYWPPFQISITVHIKPSPPLSNSSAGRDATVAKNLFPRTLSLFFFFLYLNHLPPDITGGQGLNGFKNFLQLHIIYTTNGTTFFFNDKKTKWDYRSSKHGLI